MYCAGACFSAIRTGMAAEILLWVSFSRAALVASVTLINWSEMPSQTGEKPKGDSTQRAGIRCWIQSRRWNQPLWSSPHRGAENQDLHHPSSSARGLGIWNAPPGRWGRMTWVRWTGRICWPGTDLVFSMAMLSNSIVFNFAWGIHLLCQSIRTGCFHSQPQGVLGHVDFREGPSISKILQGGKAD